MPRTKNIPQKAAIRLNTGVDAELIGSAEAGKILGVDSSTLRRWVAEGRLNGVKAGRNWRFDRRDVEQIASLAISASKPGISAQEIDSEPLLASLWLQIEDRFGKQLLVEVKKSAQRLQAAASNHAETPPSLLWELIGYASEACVTDLHVEPTGKFTWIRCRMDGVLHEAFRLPPQAALVLIREMKEIAGLNPDESRSPLDGSAQLELSGATFTLLCNTSPSVHGENMVIKVLDERQFVLGLANLGMTQSVITSLKHLISRKDGLIVASGARDSGKTTTIYSMLCELNKPNRKIVTIEDTVEILFPGMQQIPLNASVGLNFPRSIRNAFRQNADVVMISEIRDDDSASLLCEGAQKGHLMLGTMISADASTALTQLASMTREGNARLVDTVIGVIAQTLVRHLCPDCKEAHKPKENELKGLDIPTSHKVYRASGCAKCFGTGYRGLLPLAEIIVVDEDIKEALDAGRYKDIEQLARQSGYKPMLQGGTETITRGETSIDEIRRVFNIRFE